MAEEQSQGGKPTKLGRWRWRFREESMFGDVVDPAIRLGNRQWYTTPQVEVLSVVVVAGALGLWIMTRERLETSLTTLWDAIVNAVLLLVYLVVFVVLAILGYLYRSRFKFQLGLAQCGASVVAAVFIIQRLMPQVLVADLATAMLAVFTLRRGITDLMDGWKERQVEGKL